MVCLPIVDGQQNVVSESYFYFMNEMCSAGAKRQFSLSDLGVGGVSQTAAAISQAVFATEPWLNGWTFELLDEAGNVIATRTTADVDRNFDGRIDAETERGWYAFTDLLPGNYTVREVQQAGWLQTSPARRNFRSSPNP